MSQESNILPPEEVQNFSWLLEGWAYSLTSALQGMGCADASFEVAGEPGAAGSMAEAAPDDETKADATGDEPAAAGETGLRWWAQSFNLHSSHCVWMGAEESARREIGRQALIAAGIDEPEDADIESTFREIVIQSMSGLAARLTTRCGREVTALSGTLIPEVQGAGIERLITVKIGESVQFDLTFVASSEFLQQLVRAGFYRGSGWIARDQRSGDRRGTRARAGGSPAEYEEPAAENTATPDGLPFDSLLDMDIPVSISFGTAKLRLDEALQLREGSLVVLGRTIEEPVELQVNGRVVARGDIVAVRGQYGIRILELSSRSERMNHVDPAHRPEIEASLNN
jgi:flagellar motor switch protein FliN/FliY